MRREYLGSLHAVERSSGSQYPITLGKVCILVALGSNYAIRKPLNDSDVAIMMKPAILSVKSRRPTDLR
jgi:hypothetical protein